jgi:hypothetical protein
VKQEPLTPALALLRHIVEDSRRTWRTVLLLLAGALCLTTVALAIAFAGIAGAVLVGSGSLAAAIRLLSKDRVERS